MSKDTESASSQLEKFRGTYHIMQIRQGDTQFECERSAVLLAIREKKAVAFERPDGSGVTTISVDEAYRALPKILQNTLQTISEESSNITLFFERFHGRMTSEIDLLAALMQRQARTPIAQIDRIKDEAFMHLARSQEEIHTSFEALRRNLGHIFNDMYGAKIAPDK